MRYLFPLLLACVLLRVVSTVIAALLLVFCLLIIWGILFRPRQAFAFLLVLLMARLIEVYPGWVLFLIGILTALGVAKGNWPEPVRDSRCTHESIKRLQLLGRDSTSDSSDGEHS